MKMRIRDPRGERSGMALISAAAAIVVLSAMAGLMMRMGISGQHEIEERRGETRGRYLAEAAVNASLTAMRAAAATNQPLPTAVGSSANAVAFGSGDYWATIADNGDDTLTITGQGRAGVSSSALEVVIRTTQGGIYENAIFAGNTSGDPSYALELRGVGVQGDIVNGDVFSAGDVLIEEDAAITGSTQAGGVIVGGSGQEGVKQPLPDLDAMDYANSADVDVAALFSGASYSSDSFGGSAWQMPESSPAHIFRKNPSDRSSDTSATAKDDYFLEDPYESVQSDSSSDGSNPSKITLSGQDGNPGTNGSDLVYFIDGNLWVHNMKTFSFALAHDEDEEARITIVVQGNVYFSDNIFLGNEDTDGIAFIALVDDNEPDSGNIYFGDPEFGTLEEMNAYMFAENNFYDYNLDEAGSAQVTVNGNMTAGNQVQINRDYNGQHSRLTVDFDDRIASGALTLPGLPSSSTDGAEYEVMSWRQVRAN